MVFAGDRGGGAGLFASVAVAGGGRQLVRIAGENAATPHGELGRDRYPDGGGNPQGNPINLGFDPADLDARVSVVHRRAGPVAAGDSFIVAFLATPDAASLPDPVSGVPFVASKGLWTVQEYADPSPTSPGQVAFVPNIAVPVVQVGDLIGGQVVRAIAVGDALGTAEAAPGGAPRAALAGDQVVAFTATTPGGTMVVRATHLDMTADTLRAAIGPDLGRADADRYIGPFNRAFLESAIITPARQAAFLAQVGHESASLAKWSERPTTSLPIGAQVTPNGVAWTVTASAPTQYTLQRTLANGTSATKTIDVTGPNFERYDNRQGNGPNEGRYYFGRGPLQLTFKDTYAAAGAFLGLDLVGAPGRDLLADSANRPDIGIRASGWVWSSYKRSSSVARWGASLNQLADGVDRAEAGPLPTTFAAATSNPARDQVLLPLSGIEGVNGKITRVINGGFNGIEDRANRYRRALRALSTDSGPGNNT